MKMREIPLMVTSFLIGKMVSDKEYFAAIILIIILFVFWEHYKRFLRKK